MSGHGAILYETDYIYYRDEDGGLQTVYVVPCGAGKQVFTEEQVQAMIRRHNEVRLGRKASQVALEAALDERSPPAPPAVTHTGPQ